VLLDLVGIASKGEKVGTYGEGIIEVGRAKGVENSDVDGAGQDVARNTLCAKVDALLVSEAKGLATLRAAAGVAKLLSKKGDEGCRDVVVAAEAVGYAIEFRAGTAVEEVVAEAPRGKVSDGFGGAGGGKGAGANTGGRGADRLDGEAKGKAEGDEVLWIDEGGVPCGEGAEPVGRTVASADLHTSVD